MRDFSDFAEPIFNEMDLDWWMYKEEQRVHNLARDIIIRRLKGLYSYKVYRYVLLERKVPIKNVGI